VNDAVEQHYAIADLASKIAASLRMAGKDLARLTTEDLAAYDEFHIRGRSATLDLAQGMELCPGFKVLDVGSGLGGPARALAETYSCTVMGIDLSAEFCHTSQELSRWVGLSASVTFAQGDATAFAYEPGAFDAAMTIHTGMNIAAKGAVYAGVHRALEPGRIFAVYDILQGEGGEVLYPVPWAREPSISHLATAGEMRELLEAAGFRILQEIDSTDASETWFKEAAARAVQSGAPPVGLRQFLGSDAAPMTRNQVLNLTERRIRTVTYFCRS
jgi:ubiquinone/menaquinone biosynthesis C-methylase UbiE